MSFRAEKEKARTMLHKRMQVTMLYYGNGPFGGSTLVYPRVNSRIDAVGDLQGTSLAYAESKEAQPRLIFLREYGHTPVRGGVYIVSKVEGYRVDHIEPIDTVTITAVCTAITGDDIASYEPPEVC